MTIASGSTETVNSTVFQQTGSGSKTKIDGTATLASVFAVQGGTVEGNGTIAGNLNNTGGTLTAGGDTTAGHLTLNGATGSGNGNYTQSAGGATLVKLGGTAQGSSFDLFSVFNTATLNGTVDVKLLNNFNPFVGETFDFLTYKNRVGAYSSIVSLDAGYTYNVTYNDATGIGRLNVITVSAPVPEAGTVVSLALMLVGAGFLLRRQRKLAQQANAS